MSRRKRETGVEVFAGILAGMPWWVGPACAAFLYVSFRFIFPAILRSNSKADDLLAGPFGAILVPLLQELAPFAALFVLVVWGGAELQKRRKRRRLDRQTGLESVRDLPWAEFEELVAEAYRREGYSVEHTGGAAPDGGVDVVLRRNGQTTLVQCKHWKTWTVGVKIVRELRGVMASENADYGIVVTSGTFTSEARVFAQENRISLVDGKELIALVRSVQKKRAPSSAFATTAAVSRPTRPEPVPAVSQVTPTCPRCGSLMVHRIAKRGSSAGSPFWGCSRYPGCPGTRPR
jgi:restriction system protein